MLNEIEKSNPIIGRIITWGAGLDTDSLILAALVVAFAALLRRPLAAVLAAIIVRVCAAIGIRISDGMRAEIRTTASILVVACALFASLTLLSPPAVLEEFSVRVLLTVVLIALFTVFYRRADAFVAEFTSKGGSKATTDTTWITRLLHMAVLVTAFASIMEVWGLRIAGIVTGVGVFGAGLAIAAQDFVGNFVAGLNNISEKRFRPGDWIKVDDVVEGTVVTMDIRSTTVMGFDRVPRYVPNSKLSNNVLKNCDRADHSQIYWTFGLVLDATDDQVKAVCADLQKHIQESGDYVTDGSLLCFVLPVGLTDSAIEILIYAYAKTPEYQPYLEVCGRLTLALRAAVSNAGTALAYPTRTVLVENSPVSTGTANDPAAEQGFSVAPNGNAGGMS
jgi:MscS family membrane protein